MGTVVGKKNPNNRISITHNNSNNNVRTSPPNTINESYLRGMDSDYLLTPAYYIKSLLRRDAKMDVKSQLVSDLSVRLRTMPIKWAQDFIEQNGIDTLFNELGMINKIHTR